MRFLYDWEENKKHPAFPQGVLHCAVTAYQLESLYRQYRGTLIGDYIKTFLKRDLTVVEKKALYYGLQALLTTKVLTSDRKRI